jgi:hypothetical protein
MVAPAVWSAGAPKDKATWLDMRASELIGKHVRAREVNRSARSRT